MSDLKDKVIMITGAAQGFGRVLAYAFAERGAKIALCGIKDEGPAIIAINPGSMLGSKMVKEAFGVPGGDLRIGAEVLTRAALSDEFGAAAGKYFDNDQGAFAAPHPDALDLRKSEELVRVIEAISSQLKISAPDA